MMDRKAAVLLSLGMEIIGLIVAAIYIGQYLDEKYEWKGNGTMAAIAIAFAGWILHLFVAIRALDKADETGNTKSE